MLVIDKTNKTKIKKVLVVDDDRLILGSIKKQLKDEMLSIQLIDDPIEALAEVGKNKYDLVLCDIRMKSISGLEVLKRLKSNYPDVPVIIISGYIDDKIMKDAKNLGSNAFLIKPITKKILIDSIHNVFNKSLIYKD